MPILRAVLLWILMLGGGALAHDPQHPELDQWYRNLKRGDVGCCGLDDCKPTDYRQRQDGAIEVWIDQRFPDIVEPRWAPVPDYAFTYPNEPNQTGSAVACWFNNQVWCFVPKGAGV